MDAEDFDDFDGTEGHLHSETTAVHGVLSKAGYRDAIAKQEEQVRQENFDTGLAQGIATGELAGRVYGLAKQASLQPNATVSNAQVQRLSDLLLQNLAAQAAQPGQVLPELDQLIQLFPDDVQQQYALYIASIHSLPSRG